jgi:hypothetical protein
MLFERTGEHFIERCSCGTVISQCRCPGPKAERVTVNGCLTCRIQSNKKDTDKKE